MGVESGSQRILDAMDKGTSVAEAREATRTLKAHGVRACWFLQLGYPSETWEDVIRTRDLVRDERPDDVGVSVAYPLPGTKFYRSVEAELGAKRNWRDSADLAMMFRGQPLRRRHARDIATIAVNAAALPLERLRLERLARVPHEPTPVTAQTLRWDEAARPTPQPD